MKRQATIQEAELILKLYELRREEVMRRSRDAINSKFWPKNYDELIAVTSSFENPLNQAFRQVSTYWEMTYSFARNGAIDPEFLMESNGEGLLLYAKIAPFVEEYREKNSKTFFRNCEWVAKETELGALRFKMFSERAKKM